MYFELVLTALLILESSSVDGKCVQSYQELQASVFGNQNNIDNLRRAFFPINEEASISVEFHYYLRNMSFPDPLVFRWSISRSLGFIRPEFLCSLTLHIFRRSTPMVEIIIDPPCNDPGLHSSLSDWEGICRDETMVPPTLQLLNELTTNMKLEYLMDRSILANPEIHRGFSSYHYHQNKTRDHCVIGQDDFYIRVRILLFISILITTIFITYRLPIPLTDQCSQAHENSQPNSVSDKYYYMQAAIAVSIALWLSFIFYFVHGIPKHFNEANAEIDVKMYYYIFCFLVFFANPFVTFCYIIWLFKKNKLRDKLIANGCGRLFSLIIIIYYCFGLTLITCVAQFIAFHSFYIAIATTVVSVYQILSFIILSTAIALLIVIDVAELLKFLTCRKTRFNFTLLVLNVFFILIFVNFVYINEHGDIAAIVHSLALVGLSLAGLINKDTIKQVLWSKYKKSNSNSYVV